MNLGYRVKQVRKELGLTQLELAKSIGKTQTYIQSLESRDSRKTDSASALAKALSVNLEWLQTGEGNKYLSSADETRDIKSLVSNNPLDTILAMRGKVSKRSTERLLIIEKKASDGLLSDDDLDELLRMAEYLESKHN